MSSSESTTDLPQFSEGPPMPEMCQASLQNDDVQQLFADLAACTTITSVQEKGSEEAYAEPGPAALDVARSRLLNRSIRALQVRYTYEDKDWTDTLMCLPTEIRLVRCQHPGGPG